MINNNEKLGVFIVPTGIGASIGGYAGDAGSYARKLSKICRLIVNPNVVNAGCFSAINDKMLYVEGYSLDEFFKGKINLMQSTGNKVGIVFDKAIPEDVLNVHINTFNAVKVVYGIDICGYEITEEPVGVEFTLDDAGVSAGNVNNINTLLKASEKILKRGAEVLTLVCMFDDPEDMNEDYANGSGTDPVGGVEAVISHYISKNLQVPCAHSPAFADYQIYPDLINPKAAAEYITPTFLPCVLLGLSNAPKFAKNNGINVDDVDFLVMPYNSLGCIPVFEAIKRNIPVFAIKENSTALDVRNENLHKSDKIKVFDTYEACYNFINSGMDLTS